MIGKTFQYDGVVWTVIGVTADAAICSSESEKGAWRFTFDELRGILK